MTVRHLLSVSVALAALAGCGGGGPEASPPAHAVVVGATSGHHPTSSRLERDLGNGFRQGLYRLAVMSQPADDAADLGQDLPTGTLSRVRCAAAATRPATAARPWTCDVRWRTVAGAARRTRYQVRAFANGCFAAGATPRLPPHRDATIESYSEHPLNAIASARKGC